MSKRVARTAVLLTVAAAAFAAAAAASPPPTRITSLGVGPVPDYGMVNVNGTLYLVYQTTASGSSAPNGLAMTAISPAGHVSASVPVLSGWTPGRPGLVFGSGFLEVVFGAMSPGPTPTSGVWAMNSSDLGHSWTPPANVAGGGPLEGLVHGADVTAQITGGNGVLTLPQAGGLVVQQGFGAGSPAQLVTDGSDDFVADVNSAVDGAGTVVAGWQSLAGQGGDWLRAVAPALGSPQLVPGQHRNQLVVAGSDSGAGVYAAYTPDNTVVRLLRYGGGSVAVGKASGIGTDTLGVATGLARRIWVMWGDGHGVAVTRSNKAVTRFEPIQRLAYQSTTLYRLGGDGRNGPLDLLVDEIPNTPGQIPGTFFARVLPELSATVSVTAVKNTKGQVVLHKATVHVTDAGDPVGGATVKIGGQQKKTSGSGTAKLTLPASLKGKVAVTVSAPGYATLTTIVHV
jgi:hypothetical protein